ncbi:hypothetical protein N7471_013497 [Penicillium samsonianum]|uniref:uncharacterized protein n=1 Tax=Penicillium samsonianum TaxID=1882272 RepID=UPI00254888D0|nr:uncharacterized protein N7471_013497 [Penicillium samsonianum]KAJ6118877.1 hypothetical protein N7471_013497 [Penicillium samsonianum]
MSKRGDPMLKFGLAQVRSRAWSFAQSSAGVDPWPGGPANGSRQVCTNLGNAPPKARTKRQGE